MVDQAAEKPAFNTWIAVGIALLIVCGTLSVHYLPIVDYPNHIARAYIESGLAKNPAFATEYSLNFSPLPNVASDLVLSALIRILPVDLAARLFVVLIELTWFAGCVAISKIVWRRITLGCCAAMLLVLHSPLQYGFVNYAIGASLVLCATAAWLAWCEQKSAFRFVLMIALAVATYLSHLAAFGALGILCGSVALSRVVLRKQSILAAIGSMLPLAMPFALFFLFMQKSGEVGIIVFNNIAGKLIALIGPLRSYNTVLDLIVGLVLLGASIAILLQLKGAGMLSRISIEMSAAVIGLVLIFLVLPKEVMTASGADARMPPIAAALLCMIIGEALSEQRVWIASVIAVTALVVRDSEILWSWRTLGARMATVVQAFDVLPSDTRMMFLLSTPAQGDTAKADRVMEHVGFYAVTKREAFVPMMFAAPSQQPLVARRWGAHAITREELFANERSSFPYIMGVGDEARSKIEKSACCTEVRRADIITIYRNNTAQP